VDRHSELTGRAGRYSPEEGNPRSSFRPEIAVDSGVRGDEGPSTHVSRITFVRQHAFEGDDLRDAILTKEAILVALSWTSKDS